MIRARLVFVCVIALIGACSTGSVGERPLGNTSTKVLLPAGSDLTYTRKPHQEGYVYFDGKLELTGVVLAYWQAHYLEETPTTLAQTNPIREMHLRFYPDARSQDLLPAFKSTPELEVRPSRIFLYRSLEPEAPLDSLHSAYAENEIAKVKAIVQDFSTLPAGFLEYKEGFAVQPAQVVVEDLVSFIEADHRFLYARAQVIEPLPVAPPEMRELPDSDSTSYLGRPWVESFYAPGPLTVRDTPAREGRVIAQLPEGAALVEKVRTVDVNWVLVRVQPEEGDTVTGFVQPADLLVVN